ncbi:MAG: hypothetical protein A2293_14680 [Elusimicrobia bacterium RIFOXYB2_FULL_49_7]|nr:MAG: hypothetical protein A2293_14680 [Elusimicrobia bacterium RIFOXYB2_FULL_49_7]
MFALAELLPREGAMSIISGNLIARQAAWNLNTASSKLADSVLRLSSGLRIQGPSDGMYEYVRANKLESDIRVYGNIRSNLEEHQSILDIAETAGDEIRTKLETMQEKAVQASDVGLTENERLALEAEYNSLLSGIEDIVNGTKYQDNGILYEAGKYNQSTNIAINSDGSVSMTMDLGKLDVGDADGINLAEADWSGVGGAAAAGTSSSNVGDALDVVDTFLAGVSGYQSQLDSHVRLTGNLVQNYEAARSSLIEVDVANEMVTYTALDVQKQAAAAMLTQANISNRSILNLFKFQYS